MSPLFPSISCASAGIRRADSDGDGGVADLACDTVAPAVPAAAQMLAWRLITEFGSLTAVLSASRERLAGQVGNDDQDQRIVDFLRWLGEGFVTALRFEISRAPVGGTSKALIDYLHMTMGCETAEHFRVVFLDSGRRLIRDEQLGTGSLTTTSVSPREVMRRALELGASALILAHNHPSGQTEPSAADIELTMTIARAGRCLDIVVADHVIISRTGWVSLRERGLI